MVNKKVLFCLAVAVAVGLGTVALVGGTDVLSLNGAAPTYTLTLDGSNGAITGAYSTEILVNSDAQTTSGKSFRVSYYNAMVSTNTTYTYAQLKSGSNVGGYLYSTDGVSGLKTITVTFSATKAPLPLSFRYSGFQFQHGHQLDLWDLRYRHQEFFQNSCERQCRLYRFDRLDL